MAQWARMLAVQAGEHEWESQHPHKRLDVAMCTAVTPRAVRARDKMIDMTYWPLT